MTYRTNVPILLIDDDEDDRYLLDQAFARVLPRRARVLLGDGEEAVTYLHNCSQPPPLIVTDLNMPLLSGWELLCRLRQTSPFEAVPIVVLSTSGSADDEHRCCRAGANAYLTKPTTIAGLTELVQCMARLWLPGSYR